MPSGAKKPTDVRPLEAREESIEDFIADSLVSF
jgi:hypothetical protein